MNDETPPSRTPVEAEPANVGGGLVDIRGAMGVQLGDGNTQINYYYSERTWANRAVPPLVDVAGAIDSPYRGLNAYEERDAAFFFGREVAAIGVLDRMSASLHGGGPVVVSGVSGAGKSSLFRAGVLPRLRGVGLASAPGSMSWPCLLFTPTGTPLDELAVRVAQLIGTGAQDLRRGLARDAAGFALAARQATLSASLRPKALSDGQEGPRQLLLLVDQFEQLFTQCSDEEERHGFVTALHAAASVRDGDLAPAALVVLGVRADFEARCAEYPQLADAIQNRYLLMPMTERQLRMAITEPARKAGSSVDRELVDVLVHEVSAHRRAGGGFGALPLLSHALDQAWRSRVGETVTVADYERTGGIEGAVAESAQRVYEGLTPAQRSAAREIFIRLTATSSDGTVTAGRAVRSELTEGKGGAEADDVEEVLAAFTTERLLTIAANTVEMSHEALLTAWPLLRDTWLAETQADRIVGTRLHQAAAEWTGSSRDSSFLYSGSLLQSANDMATRIAGDASRHPPLSQNERDFLGASFDAHRRKLRRGRTFIAALVAMVVALASASVFAFKARDEAERQRNVAVARQLISQSELQLASDPVLAKLLAIAAWHMHPSTAARYATLASAEGRGIAELRGDTGAVMSLAFSPDAKTIAVGGFDEEVLLWDVATGRQVGPALVGIRGAIDTLAFSPDAQTLVTGGTLDGRARLWDVATGNEVGKTGPGHKDSVRSVAFSPNGELLATGSGDRTVRLWDVASGRQIGDPLTGHTELGVDSVAFSPDGKTLATGGGDRTVRLWDVASGNQIGNPLAGHTLGVSSVAFNPDGKTLVTASDDMTVRLWKVATGDQVGAPLIGHDAPINSVAFSADGNTLATGGDDETVRLWDVATGKQIGEPLTSHTSAVFAVAFSPEGSTLATGGDDEAVRLWDVATGRPIGHPISLGDPLTPGGQAVNSVAFNPNGNTFVTAGSKGSVRLWDVATGRPIGDPLVGHTASVNSVVFSPDGEILATGSTDNTVRLWDVATGRPTREPITSPTQLMFSVAFSPDGNTLATAGNDSEIILWDVSTGQQVGDPLSGHEDSVNSVAFSADGKTLASGSWDTTVRLWDISTSQQIGDPLMGHSSWVEAVAFSPDGHTLASGDADATVRLWDVTTGRQIGEPLTNHSDAIESVAFSPDGLTLASGSQDDTVRLWDVATRRQIGDPLIAHTWDVSSVAFDSDGQILASSGEDGTARLWDLSYITDPATRLCVGSRSLSRDEWNQYVGSGPKFDAACP